MYCLLKKKVKSVSKNKLFDLIKAYAFLITPVILVYGLYMMLDNNNLIFGISGALIFIVSLCIFLIVGYYKDVHTKLYKFFYYGYSIIAILIILFIFIWQNGINIFILSENLYVNEVTINIFFSLTIIFGIGSLLLKLIKHSNSENKD